MLTFFSKHSEPLALNCVGNLGLDFSVTFLRSRARILSLISENEWRLMVWRFGDGACSDTRGICSGFLRLRRQVGEPPFQQPPWSLVCCLGCVLLLSACALDVLWALTFPTMYIRMIFWDSMHQLPTFQCMLLSCYQKPSLLLSLHGT